LGIAKPMGGRSGALKPWGRSSSTTSPSSATRPSISDSFRIEPSGISPVEQALGDGILDQAVDHPLQRPGAERRIPAEFGDPLARRLVSRERQAAFLQPLGDPRQLDVDDLGHLGAAQPMEDQHVVQAVQELRPEGAADSLEA
jgi:hypothetical protein